ncbi:Qat anti-phage system QueC-like protein QatC [Clostridium tyrobutyricum]|uniref:Qat anti-phage system QueC-like protein QatC n=1 Tax=Clostridium tyrobutyricum TaxID=1519 RepID=UPI002B1FEB5D|nr:Qat anti-phage system QueC-like protein QatC [Clostridium tyrobutyricum]MEA5009155.1 Qat anti-phage system QueC-like protein QatC [Clostridium tyrobutyricum]
MIILCKVDDEDNLEINNDIELNINDNNSFTYTFWNGIKNVPHFYSQEGIDLLYMSLFVFAADRLIKREDADDCWSRNIELYLPVLSFEKWNVLKGIVEEMLGFLSGDYWKIHFRKRKLTGEEISIKQKMERNKKLKIDYNKICMFSGGLDSFIGAIDLLEISNSNLLFISHYGGGKGTKQFQDVLKQNLIDRYGILEECFCQNYATVKNGIEDTTRTRSLMFFSHAIVLATAMNNNVTLIIPENGLISLNIPLTYSRLGTSSTRTTHPHYIQMLQDLIKRLGIAVQIINPYQFKTKGEMILECKNREFLQQNIPNTMSCSHPDVGRYNGETEVRHCGYCLPCTIRKAAIKRGRLIDSGKYYDENYSLGITAKESLNAYRLSLEKFNPKYAFLKIQCSGPITNKINDFAQLYIRGMEELSAYLEEFNV